MFDWPFWQIVVIFAMNGCEILLPVKYVEHKVTKNVCYELFVDKFVDTAFPSPQNFCKTSKKTCIGNISCIRDGHLDLKSSENKQFYSDLF